MTMFRNLIFDPSPRPQGAGTKKIVQVHVPFMWVTHTPNLVEFRKKKNDPQPPKVPPSPTPGHDNAFVYLQLSYFFVLKYINCFNWFKQVSTIYDLEHILKNTTLSLWKLSVYSLKIV